MSNHDLVGGSCVQCGVLSQYAYRIADCPGAPARAKEPSVDLGRSAAGVRTNCLTCGSIHHVTEQHEATTRPRVTPLTGVGLVDDRAKLDETMGPDGQQKTYLVLSEAERAKGYVRPVRTKYIHVGRPGPRFPLVDIADASANYGPEYVKYEPYPESERPLLGRGWTQAQLDSIGKGCGAVTTMSLPLAETYAAQPGYYGGTFCATCRTHLPVGADGEFIWEDGSRVGT